MARFPAPASRNAVEPGCSRCPALADARERIAWGNGPRDASVVVVGEAPAAGDPDRDRWQGGNHTGLAYTSAHSGRTVRDLMAAVGYAEDCYYTNAVKCFPKEVDGQSNREPTAEELATCRSHLRTELDQVDPAVVVPTGQHATRSVLAVEGRSLDGFLDAVLDVHECPTLGTPVVPVLHPSYQAVWIRRLGYDPRSYERALADVLREVGA